MRIKELAELTGTTVRSIRYYHQIGLLPVPGQRYGVRDYGMVHVARLVRIRWLAQAGIPLSTVATMVSPPAQEPVLGDLKAAVEAIDGQLAELHAQRERITGLIAAVERDGLLSPMPAAMVRFYDAMLARAGDDTVRRVVQRERDFLELAFYRGDMPPAAAVVYEKLTEAHLAESATLFGHIAERTDRTDPGQIEETAAAVVDRITRQLGPDLPGVLRSIDPATARRAADLYVRLADPAERATARAIGDALLTIIEKGQTP